MSAATKSILIVDDSRPMRVRLKQICCDMGFKTYEANDGKEALRILLEVTVDLVLTDWNMPNMNGRQLIDAVKRVERLQSLPFILVTAETEKASIIDSLMSGAKDYIVKPFADATVKQKLCVALGVPLQK